jgi:hypothetical protein
LAVPFRVTFRPSISLPIPKPGFAATALVLSLLAGTGLRLAWGGDIEFKGDERLIFEETQRFRAEGTWPVASLPTSNGIRNPGGAYWPFDLLAGLFGAVSPPDLARLVQLTNLLAFVGFAAFVWRCVPPGERERWQWGLALAAVNPLCVLFQRKIWPPSVMPILLLVSLLGWWHRDRRWGAFLWGFVGVALGQIHLAALFCAAGFAAWAFLFDRRGVRWRWWVIGATLAAITFVPWALAIRNDPTLPSGSVAKWGNLFTMRFGVLWVTEPLGVNLQYSLGKDFGDFLRYPILGTTPTYVVAGLHAAALAVGLATYARGLRFAWRERASWRDLVTGRTSATSFTVMACLVGYGVAITAPRLMVHRHYLLEAFPLTFVGFASVALSGDRARTGRRLLAALLAVHATISFAFLHYVHVNPRPLRGDYGTPHAAQIALGLPDR